MTERYSEDEAISAVTRLTRTQLMSFVETEIIIPIHTDNGLSFRRVDLVRMELLCELSENFNIEDDALGIVISLIDQLHDVRGELRSLLEVINAEPTKVRERIGKALIRNRSGA